MHAKKVSRKSVSYSQNSSVSWWKDKRLLPVCIGLGIVSLMILSVFAYSGNTSSVVEEEYNGHIFMYQENGGWLLRYQGQELVFAFLPKDLVYLSVPQFPFQQKVYLAGEPGNVDFSSFALQRLQGFLQLTGHNVVPSCDREEGCGDMPVVACDNASGSVILWKSSETTEVFTDNACLVVAVASQDEIALTDALAYHLLGVMP